MSLADDFIVGPQYIVVTNDKTFDSGDFPKLAVNSKSDIPTNFERIGVIGGGELNGSLARLGAIDELLLDIEPVKLHDGIKLFGNHDVPLKLEILSAQTIGESTKQRHYKVVHGSNAPAM
jgi:dihydrofolate reductase